MKFQFPLILSFLPVRAPFGDDLLLIQPCPNRLVGTLHLNKICGDRVRFLVLLVIWFGTGNSDMTVSSASVDAAVNGYLEKSGEVKQEGYCKSTGWLASSPPPPVHCTSWLKGHETKISTEDRDFKVRCRILYLPPPP